MATNRSIGEKIKIKLASVTLKGERETQYGVIYNYEIVSQDGEAFNIGKKEKDKLKVGDEIEVEVTAMNSYGTTVKSVMAANANSSNWKGGGKGTYTNYDARSQASMNATSAINAAIELIKAGVIDAKQMITTADKVFGYIQGKVLAVDPNAYKYSAPMVNAEATTEQAKPATAQANTAEKVDDYYTAEANDDDLPF